MKGKIYPRHDRRAWVVVWYDAKARKDRFIYKIDGQPMPFTAYQIKKGQVVLDKKGRPIPDKDKCHGYELARKLRGRIQARWEQHERGECQFRIEEFTKAGWTEVVDYYYKWIEDVIEPNRKPATIKGYKSYARTWIEPFFAEHPVRLHEVELDTLISLLNFIKKGLKTKNTGENPKTKMILDAHKQNPGLSSPKLQKIIQEQHGVKITDSWIRRTIADSKKAKSKPPKPENIGKTALNIMSSFHSMMDYAFRSKRIATVPPFPKREDYGLLDKEIDYLTPDEFDQVFNQIPTAHKPIFLWIKLHYRRPGEACALHKIDYDPVNDYFKVRRAISARKVVDSVKTNWKKPKIHRVVCDADFSPIAKKLLNENEDTPFLFVNPNARKDGRRYTLEALRNIWYGACDKAGIRRIWPYRGLKHTACTEYIESGGTVEGLMILTDHARRESAEQYIDITLKRKRMAMEEAKRQRELAKEERRSAEESANPNCQNLVNVIPFKRKAK